MPSEVCSPIRVFHHAPSLVPEVRFLKFPWAFLAATPSSSLKYRIWKLVLLSFDKFCNCFLLVDDSEVKCRQTRVLEPKQDVLEIALAKAMFLKQSLTIDFFKNYANAIQNL